MLRMSQTNPSTRKLSEVARRIVIPDGIVSTAWPRVEARIHEFGDSFDEWQRGAATLMLGKRENGDYAATVGGIVLSIPRQVAKTFMVSRIIFALCTLFPGLTVLWTAHRTRTATKTFMSLLGYTNKKTVAPFIDKTRSANGEQEIRFKNGSIIMFGARESGFGRGFDEVDIEVFDEAQILTEKALEDMTPAAQQSRFPSGALLFFMGTPPRPTDPGEEFRMRRKEALSFARDAAFGEVVVGEDMLYIECSADPDADPNDRAQWAKANPSYPHRTPLRSMLRTRKQLTSDASWKREALGIWDENAESRAISESVWSSTGVAPDEVVREGVKSYAVAYSFDGAKVALCGALKHDDGVHVELVDALDIGDKRVSVDASESVASLADWLAKRASNCAQIAIVGAAGEPLVQALRDRKVPKTVIRFLSTRDYKAACSMALDGLVDKSLTHTSTGQEVLDLSVGLVGKKVRGDGWGWESLGDPGDEVPVEAMSVAYWAARTSKRVPGRKQRVAV